MTREEFEERTGASVGEDEFKAICHTYGCSLLGVEDFYSALEGEKDAVLELIESTGYGIRKLSGAGERRKGRAKQRPEEIIRLKSELAEALVLLYKNTGNPQYIKKAKEVAGETEVIRYKIQHGIALGESEREYVTGLLKDRNDG